MTNYKKEKPGTSKKKRVMLIAGSIIAFLALFIVVSNFIWINPRETLFYKIQQHLTYNQEDWENYEKYKQNVENLSSTEGGIVDFVEAFDANDLYPVDTNRVDMSIRDAEIQKIRDARFENLVVATNAPDDEDAQSALCRLTQGRLTDVIINQKLNIKVGKCYENPNTEGNFNCVSCMILLYNREKDDWQEAPDGDNFMHNAYDFYQPSEGDYWEAKDLSIKIPFDYELYKKYGY